MRNSTRIIFRIVLLILIVILARRVTIIYWPSINATYRKHFRDPGAISGYLKSHKTAKLQIGAGGNDPADWLNSDINPQADEIYLDATVRYPFPDGSFQYIFCEHMIEHVSWEGGIEMLKECHRVLGPGGKIRIITPDLSKFVRLLDVRDDPAIQKYIAAKLRYAEWPNLPINGTYIFNMEVRGWGHQFVYDAATLRKSLELAGFGEIRQYAMTERTDPVFNEAEIRMRNPGSDLWILNEWESMAFEAIRR